MELFTYVWRVDELIWFSVFFFSYSIIFFSDSNFFLSDSNIFISDLSCSFLARSWAISAKSCRSLWIKGGDGGGIAASEQIIVTLARVDKLVPVPAISGNDCDLELKLGIIFNGKYFRDNIYCVAKNWKVLKQKILLQ